MELTLISNDPKPLVISKRLSQINTYYWTYEDHLNTFKNNAGLSIEEYLSHLGLDQYAKGSISAYLEKHIEDR